MFYSFDKVFKSSQRANFEDMNISIYELKLFAGMRDVKVKKHMKKMNYLNFYAKMVTKHTMNHHLN